MRWRFFLIIITAFFSSPPQLSSIESAFSFWVSKGLDTKEKTLNVEAVTQSVNGGQNGYSDRLNRYNNLAVMLDINKD